MRSCITHFSWPDTGLCEVPSKPTLAKSKGVGQYMCVFLCKCVCVYVHMYAQNLLCIRIQMCECLCVCIKENLSICLSNHFSFLLF